MSSPPAAGSECATGSRQEEQHQEEDEGGEGDETGHRAAFARGRRYCVEKGDGHLELPANRVRGSTAPTITSMTKLICDIGHADDNDGALNDGDVLGADRSGQEADETGPTEDDFGDRCPGKDVPELLLGRLHARGRTTNAGAAPTAPHVGECDKILRTAGVCDLVVPLVRATSATTRWTISYNRHPDALPPWRILRTAESGSRNLGRSQGRRRCYGALRC